MHEDATSRGTAPSPPSHESPPLSRASSATAEPAPAAAPTLGGVYVGPPVIQRALLYSFWDGLLANGMIALQETFAIAAAVSLSASTIAIALMSSLPLLLGSIAQFLVPMLADPAKGRKRYVLLGVRLQAIFLFVCAFTGFLPSGVAPWVYVGCFILAAVSATSTTSYWVDWMGDLIPSTVRGRHFAWRGVWFAWMHLACSLGAGLVAREYTSHNAPWSVFACILAAASLFRLGSYSFLRRQHEPVSHRLLEPFSPLKFRPGGDFLTFSMATAFFAGAAAMSGPFFTVWYLRDLHFDYFNLAVALSCTVLGSIAFVGFWGRAVDNFGTSRVLWIAGLLITVIPVPYIFFEHIQAIWLCNFYSGAVWSGYNLAVFNHLLSASDKTRRSHYIAFASLVSGVVGCAFTLLGGWLATRLPPLMGYSLRSLFLASFILRLLVCLGFFRRFREYEEALPKRSRELFLEIPGYRVGLGLFRNVFRAFRST